jgi:hypothetical protein
LLLDQTKLIRRQQLRLEYSLQIDQGLHFLLYLGVSRSTSPFLLRRVDELLQIEIELANINGLWSLW